MNLAYFPFDSQMCTVEIESFGYTMADLKYRCEKLKLIHDKRHSSEQLLVIAMYFALINLDLKRAGFSLLLILLAPSWYSGDSSVQMSPDVMLPQFNVLGHRQRLIEISLSSGNYSRLLADVIFTRDMGYYLIQVSC